MRTYADSSFIVRMVVSETDSPQAIARFRQLGSPKLFFLGLHRLEVQNAILQRAFFQRRTGSPLERRNADRERDAALMRLQHLLEHRTFLELAVDMETALARAATLSAAYTEQFGARSIDLLHVACAIILKAELFLTTDSRQERLAVAEGLRVN